MKHAVMGVGIAGAGKTTVLKRLALRHRFAYISRDDLMLALTGDPHEQAGREMIGKFADNVALVELGRRPGVVIDSTFVDKTKRVRKIIHLRLIGADRVIGIFFDTPLAVARRRNRGRRFAVAEHILRAQYRMILEHPPALSDGFDALYSFKELSVLEEKEFGPH